MGDDEQHNETIGLTVDFWKKTLDKSKTNLIIMWVGITILGISIINMAVIWKGKRRHNSNANGFIV